MCVRVYTRVNFVQLFPILRVEEGRYFLPLKMSSFAQENTKLVKFALRFIRGTLFMNITRPHGFKIHSTFPDFLSEKR